MLTALSKVCVRVGVREVEPGDSICLCVQPSWGGAAGSESGMPPSTQTPHVNEGHGACARAAERARAAGGLGTAGVGPHCPGRGITSLRAACQESRAFVHVTGRGHHGKRCF